MTTTTFIQPLRPDVSVPARDLLTPGTPTDSLALVARISEDLIRAGHGATSAAFVQLANDCTTHRQLVDLIRCTVTVE